MLNSIHGKFVDKIVDLFMQYAAENSELQQSKVADIVKIKKGEADISANSKTRVNTLLATVAKEARSNNTLRKKLIPLIDQYSTSLDKVLTKRHFLAFNSENIASKLGELKSLINQQGSSESDMRVQLEEQKQKEEYESQVNRFNLEQQLQKLPNNGSGGIDGNEQPSDQEYEGSETPRFPSSPRNNERKKVFLQPKFGFISDKNFEALLDPGRKTRMQGEQRNGNEIRGNQEAQRKTEEGEHRGRGPKFDEYMTIQSNTPRRTTSSENAGIDTQGRHTNPGYNGGKTPKFPSSPFGSLPLSDFDPFSDEDIRAMIDLGLKTRKQGEQRNGNKIRGNQEAQRKTEEGEHRGRGPKFDEYMTIQSNTPRRTTRNENTGIDTQGRHTNPGYNGGTTPRVPFIRINRQQDKVITQPALQNGGTGGPSCDDLIAALNDARKNGMRDGIMGIAGKLYRMGTDAARAENTKLMKQINEVFRTSYANLLVPSHLLTTTVDEFEGENLVDPNRNINVQEVVQYLRDNLKNIKCEDNPQERPLSNSMPTKTFENRTVNLLKQANGMRNGQTMCTPYNTGGYHWSLITLTKTSENQIAIAFIDSNGTNIPTGVEEKLTAGLLSASKNTGIGSTFQFIGQKVQMAVTYLNGENGSDNNCGAWCCAVAEHIDQQIGLGSKDTVANLSKTFLSQAKKDFDIEAVRGKMMANLLAEHR